MSDSLFEFNEDKILEAKKHIDNRYIANYGEKAAHAVFVRILPLLKGNIPLSYILEYAHAEYIEKICKIYDPIEGAFNPSNKTFKVWEFFFKPFLKRLDLVLEEGYSYVLAGYNESGKTFTSLLLLIEIALDTDYTYYYINARDLILLYNKVNFSGEYEQYEKDALSHMIRCDFLVIDELGKENITTNSISALETILKERGSFNKSTVMITNLILTDKENEIKSCYGNSIWSYITQKYRFLVFSGQGMLRAKTREAWKI